MTSTVFIFSAVLMTGTPDIVQVSGCDGCGTAAALPAACVGCGAPCGGGICPGAADPNPNERTGLLASLRRRLTPAPSSGCCGGRPRLFSGGLFNGPVLQGGLLGRIRGVAPAPAGCSGPGCGGCNEPPIVIGHTPINPCAQAPAAIVAPAAPPAAMPMNPMPMGETKPTDPAPKPKDKGAVSIPSLPIVPVSPASGSLESLSKPRF